MGQTRAKAGMDFDQYKGDLSNDFYSVRDNLVSLSGIKYKDYLKTLKPRYVHVWRDLLLGYFSLILSVSLLFLIDQQFILMSGLAAFSLAVVIGYILHYISTFFHCASHHNLARNRSVNDRLANGFMGPLFGITVERYRSIHFAHHRHLGTREDTENDYIRPLNLRFLWESFTGWRFAKTLIRHIGLSRNSDPSAEKQSGLLNPVLVAAACLHLAIVVIPFIFGYFWVPIGWLAGFFIMLPFFQALRLVLEHRPENPPDENAGANNVYAAVSRLFGKGPVASTFGGAGFNRHLLHHWEPQISYTNLYDLELYFRETPLAPILEKRTSTYFRTFKHLFKF